MLREHPRAVALSVIAADALLIAAVATSVPWLTGGDAPAGVDGAATLTDRAAGSTLIVLGVPVWLGALYAAGFYASIRRWSSLELLCGMGEAALLGVVGTAAMTFLLAPAAVPARDFWLFLGGTTLAVGAEKTLIRLLQYKARTLGYNTRNIVIVGLGEEGQDYAREVESHPEWGLRILAFLRDRGLGGAPGPPGAKEEDPPLREFEGYRVLTGAPALFEEMRAGGHIDEVVLALPESELNVHRETLEECLRSGIPVRILEYEGLRHVWRAKSDRVGRFETTLLSAAPLAGWELRAKTGLDLVGGVIGSVLFVASCIVLAPLIVLDSPGPVLFRQVRVGRRGQRFTLFKFRSMVETAEEQLQQLARANEMQGHFFKMKDDPRVTRVGRFLRAYHLDELPQFWNVLRGDMSLVGPRPPTEAEVGRYDDHHLSRLGMKPGITGPWQVQGREKVTDFERVVELDRNYIQNWSLAGDVKILLKTLLLFLNGRPSS